MHALTAAHKTLPLGTYGRVTNLDNKRTVVVKINDRGPFVKGRIVDLSYRAAQELDMVETGTSLVKLEALGRLQKIVVGGKIKYVYIPVNYYVGEFTIQVGSFKEKINATNLLGRLAMHYNNAHIAVYKTGIHTFYRVRVARCTTLEEAREIEQELEQEGYPGAIIVSP
jgi:rare lipoprotein A